MILFRLLHFAIRIVGSFFFVFFLQIQFDGKTLESYLSEFGQKFVVTRSLEKVSQDGVKIIRGFTSPQKKDSELRQISSSQATQYIKEFSKRISLPNEKDFKKEKDSSK